MRRRVAGAILSCALFPLLLSLAQAQPKLQPRPSPPAPQQQPAVPAPVAGTIETIAQNMESVLPLIKAASGYTNVEMVTGDNNYRAVRAQINQTTVIIGPEICKEGKCRALAFFANFGKQQSIDLSWLNAWSSQTIFGKTYIDKQGNIIFSMPIHFWGGVSPRYVTESADLFSAVLKSAFEFQPGK